MASSQRPKLTFVCSKCLGLYASRVELLSYKCLQPDVHKDQPKVRAAWSFEKLRLERSDPPSGTEPPSGLLGNPDPRTRDYGINAPPQIRPMPKVDFQGEFRLCNPLRCKGKRCTHPHSIEEQAAWNAEKFGGRLNNN